MDRPRTHLHSALCLTAEADRTSLHLSGYSGRGEWSFNYVPDFRSDEELFVRMAQYSALFPMIQFSWAPWRMLDEEHEKMCLDAAKLHKKFSDEILRPVRESAVTGEPIVRHMEYEYPHCGYTTVLDQFMLGPNIPVAPVIEKGATKREIVLPERQWIYCDGQGYSGGQRVTVNADLQRLPYFTKKS